MSQGGVDSFQIARQAEAAFQVLASARGWYVIPTPGELDHGIDYRVEIPEAGAARPNLDFFVQLKGTQRPLRNGAIVVSGFNVRTLAYWRSKFVPVLVVVVHLPSDQFFARWFDGDVPDSRKSVSMRFESGDELLAQLVEREVRAYYGSFRAALAEPGAARAYAQLVAGILLIVDLCWNTNANMLPAWWKASESSPPERLALFQGLVIPAYTLISSTLRDFRSPLPHDVSPELALRLDDTISSILRDIDAWRVSGPVVSGDGDDAWAFDVIDVDAFAQGLPSLVSRLLELSTFVVERLSEATAQYTE